MSRRDDLNEKRNDRKNNFLDWAEEHLNRIGELTFGDKSGNSGYRSHLRVTQKTAVFSLLDTLARAFQGGGQGKRRETFIRLVEEKGNWRVSAPHLARALELHSRSSQAPCSWAAWDALQAFLKERYPWLDGRDADEKNIGVDPDEGEIKAHWPSGEKLNAGGRNLCLMHFKHSSLLYDYRNCIVHESREQTFSYEGEDDSKPLYMTVGVPGREDISEYHLVYPLGFLISLTKDCIASLRNVDQDPYARFHFGPYIIQELNKPRL